MLHLSVLIETMRREGYELQVGQPRVIIKEIDGKKCEPVEELTIDLPEEVAGKDVYKRQTLCTPACGTVELPRSFCPKARPRPARSDASNVRRG